MRRGAVRCGAVHQSWPLCSPKLCHVVQCSNIPPVRKKPFQFCCLGRDDKTDYFTFITKFSNCWKFCRKLNCSRIRNPLLEASIPHIRYSSVSSEIRAGSIHNSLHWQGVGVFPWQPNDRNPQKISSSKVVRLIWLICSDVVSSPQHIHWSKVFRGKLEISQSHLFLSVTALRSFTEIDPQGRKTAELNCLKLQFRSLGKSSLNTHCLEILCTLSIDNHGGKPFPV